MILPGALVTRVRAAATAREAALDPAVAARRIADHDGPIDAALAFEAALGGLTVGAVRLGLDTHRTHPPRDPYDEWLDREFQRRMVQIGHGGPYGATYWLDRRGWVHEIGPLDRLRPYAPDLASFLEVLLGARPPAVHFGCLLLHPCAPEDIDAIFDARERCPVGPGVARFPTDALEVLEEHTWVERVAADRGVIVSAPTLAALAEPLATLVRLDDAIQLVLLDARPEPAYRIQLAEVVARVTYTIPWHDHAFPVQLGRDADGAWTMVQAP